MPAIIFIGLGANLMDPLRQCQEALNYLDKMPESVRLATSSFYRSAPIVVGVHIPGRLPWYVNAVCKMATTLLPEQVLQNLLAIEQKMGRLRRKKWESRVIDLDLLFYNDLVLNTETLVLPHPQIQNRPFVLFPLKELEPQWEHPVLGVNINHLCNRVSFDRETLIQL